MTPAERLAYLLEPVFVPTNRQVLFADVTAAVGLEAGALVVGTIKAASAANPLLETVLIAMSTVGLGLGTDDRRAMIDQLAIAGAWPNEVRDAVKALGGVTQSRWQVEGYETEPTLETITAEVIEQQRREAKEAIQKRADAAVFAASAKFDDLGSADEITLAAEAAWAGTV